MDGESDEDLIYRIGSDKELIGSWQNVTDILNRILGTSYEESKFRKQYHKIAKRKLENYLLPSSATEESDAELLTIRQQTMALEKERKKLQTEKLEYSRFLREEARDEMITQQICEAIATLPPLKIPEYIPPRESDESYLLALSDAHYGVEFQLHDIDGNIINEYSPEIFNERMKSLLQQTVDLVKKNHITYLDVWDLGDGIDGIIRLSSQLMKLRFGVIESTVRYATYIAQWLEILSKYVRINFQMVADSNHTQLRLCNAPKNAFPDENMNRIMYLIIKARLNGNVNVQFEENPTGFCYAKKSGYSVLGAHGEFKFSNVISSLSRTFNKDFSYLLTGHIHHRKSEDEGINCEHISVRSLIGVDPYGLSRQKTSNAGASLFTFREHDGLVCENRLVVS